MKHEAGKHDYQQSRLWSYGCRILHGGLDDQASEVGCGSEDVKKTASGVSETRPKTQIACYNSCTEGLEIQGNLCPLE